MISGIANNRINQSNRYKSPAFKCRMVAVFQKASPNTPEDYGSEDYDMFGRKNFRKKCFLKKGNGSLLDQLVIQRNQDIDCESFENTGHDKGWGFITYFNGKIKNFKKSIKPANRDDEFNPFVERSIENNSDILIGFLRNARTPKEVTMNNTQPLVYKNWAMVHQGDAALLSKVYESDKDAQKIYKTTKSNDPKGFQQGNSDTNHIFKYFLYKLNKNAGTIDSDKVSEDQFIESFSQVITDLKGRGEEKFPIGNIIITNGKYILAYDEGSKIKLHLGSKKFPAKGEDYVITNLRLDKKEKDLDWELIPAAYIYFFKKEKQGGFSLERQIDLADRLGVLNTIPGVNQRILNPEALSP